MAIKLYITAIIIFLHQHSAYLPRGYSSVANWIMSQRSNTMPRHVFTSLPRRSLRVCVFLCMHYIHIQFSIRSKLNRLPLRNSNLVHFSWLKAWSAPRPRPNKSRRVDPLIASSKPKTNSWVGGIVTFDCKRLTFVE